MIKECKKCRNSMKQVPIKQKVYKGMGVWKMEVVGHEWVCDYCIWKGNAGPGKLLRESIKAYNVGR